MTRPRAQGFTIVELLIGTALALAVAAGATAMVMAFVRASVTQPAIADEQQRLRGAYDQLLTTIRGAGEGLGGTGPNMGVLLVPALYPQRRGVSTSDPELSAYDDRLTVVSMADARAGARLGAPMATLSAPVVVDVGSCGPGRATCGFLAGTRVLIADGTATGEWFGVSRVDVNRLEHVPAALSAAYAGTSETWLTGVDVKAIWFDEARRQLRLATPGGDLPWLDGVAGFSVAWFGDPRPPRGPSPPAGTPNCVVDADGTPRLPARTATDGPWTRLSPSDFVDGPWCGHAPWRFDADLFRARLLRVTVRLDRTAVVVTGPAPVLEFDIAPPNLKRAR